MVKKRYIKKKQNENIEPQQVLFDKLSREKEKEIGLSERTLEVPLYRNIIIGFFIISVLVFLCLLGQTFYMQIIKGDHFTVLAERNKFRDKQIDALRGVVYSKEGNQLVENKLNFDLTCKEDTSKKSIEQLAEIINKSEKEISEDIEDNKKGIPIIKKSLDRKTLLAIENKINNISDCQITKVNSREYPDERFFSHSLGYVGRISSDELLSLENYSGNDYVGKAGLEKEYEETLHKNPGKIQVERDVHGNKISEKIVSKPEPGKNLVLWLDKKLQEKLTNSLQNKLEEINSTKATGLVLDAKTGGVLSMVSIPSYNNNTFSEGNSEEISELLSNSENSLLNKSIAGEYPSGSVIKPIIALAALEENIISPQKKIDDTKGFIKIPNPYNPDDSHIFHDWEAHGMVDMRKAIAVSCNVYFYTIGGGYKNQKGLGVTKINKYLNLFGFGSETGIDLPGEKNGRVPTPEWKKEHKEDAWRTGDTYNLSIGQGNFSTTPLQVATAFLPIANGGTLYEPQMVRKIISEEEETLKLPQTKRDNFIKKENIEIVKEGMKEAVEYGSASLLNDLPIELGAKTGTAQISKADHCHNWVVIFAPYDDPEIVLTIMIEEVEGMQAAVLPVARDVLEWYFSEEKKTSE
ncbi:MAG: penicillin-binding protein 2 [Minisyncoccales bacterium]